MDKIIIKDFEVFGNHGVFEEEKRLGQKFVLSIEFSKILVYNYNIRVSPRGTNLVP